jgi:hypothetical protein
VQIVGELHSGTGDTGSPQAGATGLGAAPGGAQGSEAALSTACN